MDESLAHTRMSSSFMGTIGFSSPKQPRSYLDDFSLRLTRLLEKPVPLLSGPVPPYQEGHWATVQVSPINRLLQLNDFAAESEKKLSLSKLVSTIINCLEFCIKRPPGLDFPTLTMAYFSELLGVGPATAAVVSVANSCLFPPCGFAWLFGHALGVMGDSDGYYDPNFGYAFLEALTILKKYIGDRDSLMTALFESPPSFSGTYKVRRITASQALSCASEILAKCHAFQFGYLQPSFSLYNVEHTGWSFAGRLDICRSIVACVSGNQLKSTDSSTLDSADPLEAAVMDLQASLRPAFSGPLPPSVDVEFFLAGLMQSWLLENDRVKRELRNLHLSASVEVQNEGILVNELRASLYNIDVLVRNAAESLENSTPEIFKAVLQFGADAVARSEELHPDPVTAQSVTLRILPRLMGDAIVSAATEVHTIAERARSADKIVSEAQKSKEEAELMASKATQLSNQLLEDKNRLEFEKSQVEASLTALSESNQRLKSDLVAASVNLQKEMGDKANIQAKNADLEKEIAKMREILEKNDSCCSIS